jgi:hypothetical protein
VKCKQIKLISLCILVILLAFYLTGCTSTMEVVSLKYMQSDYFFTTYDKDTGKTIFSNDIGKKIIIHGENGEYLVTADGRVYSITISGTKENYSINANTPENTSIFYTKQGNVFYGGGNSNNDKDSEIMDGFLEKVIPSMEFGASNGKMQFNGGIFLFALICMITGVISFLNPKLSFMLREGWKYENVVPSENYLFLAKAGGAVGIIIGIILVFISFQ